MKLLPEVWTDTIFNLQERLHHTVLPGEIEFLKNNNLFSQLSDEQFKHLLRSIRLVKYRPGDRILREGYPGYACYVIFEGQVGVFIRNIEGAKIQLATLKRGDCLGEQILLGDTSVTRNADVDALTPVTLVYVAKKLLVDMVKNNPELRLTLIKRGYIQACDNLTSATGFFNDFREIIPNFQHLPIIEFKKDELIFEAGDRPDYVYFILKGEVLLVQQIFAEESPKIVLHRGLLFGEGGVLSYHNDYKGQRKISAIANTDLRVLAVAGDEFKRALIGNTQLKLLLSKSQKVYEIPMIGFSEQYFTIVQDMGPAITTIYRLEGIRTVISRMYILHDQFEMYVDNIKEARHYAYKNEVSKLEIDVYDKHIVGIKAFGYPSELTDLCRMLLYDELIDRATFSKLGLLGKSDTK